MSHARTEASFAALPPGTLLAGRYRLREQLGEGAYAAVYLADDENIGRAVALKVLDPLRGTDPVGRCRFEREYQVLSRLSHPHIARCHRLARDGDLDVLVMEYVEGETLADRLVSGRLPHSEAVSIAVDLASALQACHEAGVLHRDLKPANIMLHPERGAVILDFGVAWFSTAMNLTRTGATIGTPRYMAPEVFSGSLTDERTDLYSLGVCLYEMVCGRPPHLVDSVAEMAMGVHLRCPPRASTVAPGVPPAFDEVIARALAPHADDRYATAAEMREALVQGRVVSMGSLRNSVPCERCDTPRIITLPFCPGCGAPASWELEPGPNAVQLTDVPNPRAVLRWLEVRYPSALRGARSMVYSRLHHLPVPLVVGVSARSAEQLVAEASDLDVTAEVVRARAIVGARLRASEATSSEVVTAFGGHFVGFVSLLVALACAGVAEVTLAWFVGFGTILVSLAAILAIHPYVRRPLLKLGKVSGAETEESRDAERVRERLAALVHPRARRLAAAAVARALPVLTDRANGVEVWARHGILSALDDALEAAAQVDTHAAYLMSRPRSRLAVEIDAARRQVERGQSGGTERLRRLEEEREELLAASVAHDLGTRQALAACARIMEVTRAAELITPHRAMDVEGSPVPPSWDPAPATP